MVTDTGQNTNNTRLDRSPDLSPNTNTDDVSSNSTKDNEGIKRVFQTESKLTLVTIMASEGKTPNTPTKQTDYFNDNIDDNAQQDRLSL